MKAGAALEFQPRTLQAQNHENIPLSFLWIYLFAYLIIFLIYVCVFIISFIYLVNFVHKLRGKHVPLIYQQMSAAEGSWSQEKAKTLEI